MRVVIGEDEALLRRGLTLVLENAGFEVAAAAADGAQLIDLTERHLPDMVITDVRMPPTHTDEGMVAALHIAREHPAMAVVVLSQHVQRGRSGVVDACGVGGTIERGALPAIERQRRGHDQHA